MGVSPRFLTLVAVLTLVLLLPLLGACNQEGADQPDQDAGDRSTSSLFGGSTPTPEGGNGEGGGVFGGGSRMTVEEFAAACVKLEQRFSDYEPASPAAAAGVYEDLFGEIESWNPPEELAQWHKTYIRGADAALQGLRESGILDLAEDMAQAEEDEDSERIMELSERMGELAGAFERFETESSGFDDELEQVAQDVSPQTRQALEDAGCNIF